MSFCGLIKGISPKICILCVRGKINKRSFEPFCVSVFYVNSFHSTDIALEKKEKRKKKGLTRLNMLSIRSRGATDATDHI